ncbi:hypothetical protein NPIL_231321 [Nephila pilipes]|uniref:Uncharacterized protein n=1 Tax=Nephila pilipes TaxID=299642 RepID=A0A8X6QBT3_NEPPI|nr:hypothetical protein NPIL_231321 [Nephila pilipes]
MTDQRDHRYRVMDVVSQVLRNPVVQIANQQRITQKIFSNTSLQSCFSTPNQSEVLKLTVNFTWGGLHAPIVELVTLLLEKPYTPFYKEREPTFRRLDSLCHLLTAKSPRKKSTQPV